MITDCIIIRNATKGSAYSQAEAWYQENSPVSLEQDLEEYHRNGFVITRPTSIALFKIILLNDGSPSWFVRFALGDRSELISLIPCFLPKICFCRHGQLNIREYDMEQLMKKWSKRF